MVAILLMSDCHIPSLSFSSSIFFFICLWLALWWKNLVFLSPALSHMDLDHCLQNTSSWCNNVLILVFSLLMLCRFCPYPCLINSSSSYCFALRRICVLPKVCQLHATRSDRHYFLFSNSWFMGLPEASDWVQEPQIICSHFGCDTHFSSNLWSLCRRWGVGVEPDVVSSNIGS